MKLALRHHPPRDLPTPGLVWGGTTTYGWNEAGLAVIADDATGNVLWIGIEGERWRGYATREGVGLGSTENQVQAALGPPVGIIADQHGKSIAYLRSGISFLMPGDGSPVGRVSQLRVYWPYRATGDLLVISGGAHLQRKPRDACRGTNSTSWAAAT